MKLALAFLGALTCGHLLAQEELKKNSAPNSTSPSGVAWYSTWGTALAEAKRSQRPIFFIATPCQREGIPGIFSAAYATVQRDLIDTPEFIETSRNFVCVRLATFERQEHLDMVRFLLPKDESVKTPSHSAFVVFTPDGKKPLIKATPTPHDLSTPLAEAKKQLYTELKTIASKHPAQASTKDAVMEDFHSFAQALRTSAADQRLLLFIVAPQGNRMPYWKKAQAIINDPEVLGKIHVDFIGSADAQWHKVIKRDSMQVGYFIIKAEEFGRGGQMMAELPLRTSAEKIKATLLKVEASYHKAVPKRNDAEHLKRGKELGITFKSAIPFPIAPISRNTPSAPFVKAVATP